MPPSGPEWSPQDDAIVLYFAARKVHYWYRIAKDVIKVKGGPDRTIPCCQHRVKKIRKSMRDEGLEDPCRRNDKYDLDIVDPWLGRLMNKGELEDLFGLKDDKIVDEKVLELLKKHVCSLHICLKVTLIQR